MEHVRPAIEGRCYLCGKVAETVDHIPPRGCFPKPIPNDANLITVSCCTKCNNSFSKLDEWFRVFLSSAINKNTEGELVAQASRERSLGSISGRGRIRKPLETAISLSLPHIKKTKDGHLKGHIVSQQRPIKQVLIKITRGLLWKIYNQDSSSYRFSVQQIDQYISKRVIDELPSYFTTFSKVGETFVCRHHVDTGIPGSGKWGYLFYGCCGFKVSHIHEGEDVSRKSACHPIFDDF